MEALTIAKAQTELGLRVNINATKCLYAFFNGDDRILIRRTDFAKTGEPVDITVDGKTIEVGIAPGRCQIFSLR